jgi:hypothetical protein
MKAAEYLEKEWGNLGYVDTESFPYPCLILNGTAYGLYSGTLAEKSNYEVFLREYGDNKWVKPVKKGGWRAISLHPNALREEGIADTVASMGWYPVLEDEHYYKMVMESYEENFREESAPELIYALCVELERYGYLFCSSLLDSYSLDYTDVVREWYESVMGDEDWFYDQDASDGVWIPVGVALNRASDSDLVRLIKSIRSALRS